MEEKFCWPCEEPVIDKIPPCPLQCKSRKCKSYKEKDKIDLSEKLFIWVYGPPSCGKSTQCDLIAAKYGLMRVHVGALLHKEVATGSVRAKCIEDIMERGELVPNDMVLELLKREVEENAESTNGFVIDGYPRDPRQGMLFEKMIAPAHILIFLDLSRKSVMERHIPRANVSVKREDNCVAGKLQVHIFFEHHKHILDQYPHKISRVNCEEKTAEQVFQDVDRAMDKLLIKFEAEIRVKHAAMALEKASEINFPPVIPDY